MKSIKFRETYYTLVDDINVDATRLQATVEKGENTVDQIAANATGVETIYVYSDNELIGEYTGYTSAIAFALHGTQVSIELANVNVLATLNSLQSQVDATQSSVEGLAADVTSLNESQMSQDAAIEDLAEAMAE